MSEETSGSVQLTVVTQEPTPSFLSDSVQLKKLLRELTKASKEAIDVLVKGLESNDEKTRIMCADKIIQFQISTAKTVNDDSLQRLIAEIKLRNPQVKKIDSEEDEEAGSKRPIVDFTTIRRVE